MAEQCPRCGSTVDHPRQRARENGFDPHKHCVMLANQKGMVVPCWSLQNLGKHRHCDYHPICPVYAHWIIFRPVGIGGRMQAVFRTGPYDRNPVAEKHQQFATCLLNQFGAKR